MRQRWNIEPIGRFLGGDLRIEGSSTYQGRIVALTYWQNRLTATLEPLAERTADGTRWIKAPCNTPYLAELYVKTMKDSGALETMFISEHAELISLYAPQNRKCLDHEKLGRGDIIEAHR